MRIRTILAAAAAPAALAAALLGTTAAHAATLPNGNSATAVHNQSDLDALVNNGVISGNIDVAADAHVTLAWTTVNGKVTYHPSGRDDLSQLTWGGKFVTV